MYSKIRWFIFILLIPIILSGCASVVSVDRQNSLVMPDHVAKKILAKYFGEEWVDKPYLNNVSNLFCKNSEKISIKFSNIVHVAYNDSFIGSWIFLSDNLQPAGVAPPLWQQFDCSHYDWRLKVRVSNESDAKQITEALISLGAPIKGYVNFK